MDYTTLARTKQYMDSETPNGDTILPMFITGASRTMDRLCTSQPFVVDYFKLETLTLEYLTNGVVDWAGRLTVWPHKPVVTAVTALNFRYNLTDPWTAADVNKISVEAESVVYDAGLTWTDKIYVQISYAGGLAATPETLPDDFQDLVTLLAIRGYKEARSGMGDAIGVAELGQLVYTKAFPIRVTDSINVGGFARVAPWM